MKRLNITIVAGLVAALLGGLLVFSYGRNVDEKIAAGKETVPVLVAAEDLSAGAAASTLNGALITEEIPQEYLVEDALASLDEVQDLVLSAPVPAGTQLSAAFFSTGGQVAALEPAEGMVAVAVQVTLPGGVARYISPGSTVDVFVTYERLEGMTASSLRSKLVLSGVRVMSVSAAQPLAPEGEDQGGTSLPVDQVLAVLEVSPREAEKVVNGSTLGSLYLALAREGDEHSTGKGVTPDDVVKGGGS
ncbi:MAG: Flp pilus assembly protein CpaB [Actinomycetota bacterium]